MKISELRQKTPDDLTEVLRERQARLDELRFLLHQKKVKNVKEVGAIKKDIARILTLQHTNPL